MIGKLLTAIMNLIMALVSLLLSPIDLLIENAIPDIAVALDYINDLFDFIISVIGYAVDASGLSSVSISLIVAYWVFALSVPIAVATGKLAIKWYKALKP